MRGEARREQREHERAMAERLMREGIVGAGEVIASSRCREAREGLVTTKAVQTSRGFDLLHYERLEGMREAVLVTRESFDDRGRPISGVRS